MRHFIASLFTLLFFFVFVGGYTAGMHGWWWMGFGLIFLYIFSYRFIGGGH